MRDDGRVKPAKQAMEATGSHRIHVEHGRGATTQHEKRVEALLFGSQSALEVTEDEGVRDLLKSAEPGATLQTEGLEVDERVLSKPREEVQQRGLGTCDSGVMRDEENPPGAGGPS